MFMRVSRLTVKSLLQRTDHVGQTSSAALMAVAYSVRSGSVMVTQTAQTTQTSSPTISNAWQPVKSLQSADETCLTDGHWVY